MAGGDPRFAPTTTKKLAQRMLSASREIAASLPHGYHASTPLDTLLLLHVAEDDARYLEIGELDVPGATSPRVVARWVAALEKEGLIDRRDRFLALSEKGHRLVIATMEAVYAAQRALD